MLVDAHIHIALNNIYTRQSWQCASMEQKFQWTSNILKEYKKRNIYILRDGGDSLSVSQIAKEAAKAEGMIYKSPIHALCKEGSYGSFLGKPVKDMHSIKEALKSLLDHKPDHLKIILTGIVNFNKYGDVGETAFTLDELKHMAAFARDNHMPVMVHANGKEGVERAIKAGVTTIEHGYLISEAELYGMAERDIIWVPTLSPLGNIVYSDDDRFIEERGTIQRVYEEQLENIAKAIEMGIKVVLGSDAGAYRVGHGSGLIDEIEHFKRIGLKQEEIEKMCLENGLEALGLQFDELSVIK